ncbi:phosphocholine-specific phospholipase C [Phenylobacterium soli]|uniref:phospholipase C n=1 Tax=Phenylobacterium soli TaxID=2170551 RepID=A0A328AEQ5_9CAUL|nr:phospholipase C, phosphocholine-specific [Phenylobacterium soli]RAK53129.1 phospholipase C, phosphocholine-specific [Phenylobacterium soli]
MLDRRTFLAAAAAGAALPPAIARARAIDAHVRTGTIADVEHVVVFMQENRSFDHYFGTMAGVRGFGDRFPAPLPGGRTVWTQANKPGPGKPPRIAPFPLNTAQSFAHMRVEGTPHNWTDAQDAWDEGRMGHWPAVKGEHAMGFYEKADIPFQFALAEAFTLCDAYHCSMQVGTNTNRLFLFTGANDPAGRGGGPSLSNSHDSLPEQGGAPASYTWTTYAERLQAAGVSWRVYQDMADNFTDNPLVGFKPFRDSHQGAPGSDPALAREGLSTWRLDALKADVLAGRLPQVSWIVAPAKDSEHPGPSSPAQGADFTARVLDALTADPAVWAKTVLLVMFDENDGFFDHAPPPAPPSRDAAGGLIGGSTVDLAGEHHLHPNPAEAKADRPDLFGRPYGLGPRVPMYVISPWSRGGFVNSQVFDHTSVLRFLEARFGVAEPNISPWRRSVCGDLTSCFDFRAPNRAAGAPRLPATAETAARAAALPHTTRPPTPAEPAAPAQASGVRPSRPLPYRLDAVLQSSGEETIVTFANDGAAGAVFHVYDLTDLAAVPRRYTLGAGTRLQDRWGPGADLWILGPNGFHRRFRGRAPLAVTMIGATLSARLVLHLRNLSDRPLDAAVEAGAYDLAPWRVRLGPGEAARRAWPLARTGGWYDLIVAAPGSAGFLQRYAGRVETGQVSISDPAMAGPALMEWA